jgi:hypothetical protein
MSSDASAYGSTPLLESTSNTTQPQPSATCSLSPHHSVCTTPYSSSAKPSCNATCSTVLNSFERQREANIQRNRQRFVECGLEYIIKHEILPNRVESSICSGSLYKPDSSTTSQTEGTASGHTDKIVDSERQRTPMSSNRSSPQSAECESFICQTSIHIATSA